jgi:pyruvate/2-oxoglutarate/acetoin dehydrogenase E1 component
MRTIQFKRKFVKLSEEIRRDESVYLMGEEVAEYNGTRSYSKECLTNLDQKRLLILRLPELGFAGIAVGSMNGCRPIVEYMTFNFSLVGIDQIINNCENTSDERRTISIPMVSWTSGVCWTVSNALTAFSWFTNTQV